MDVGVRESFIDGECGVWRFVDFFLDSIVGC
jgi:hypothetical protein